MNVGTEHSRLMDLTIFSHDTVFLVGSREKTRNDTKQDFEIAFVKGSVNASLEKLFHASPMLYQQLTYQHNVLESLLELLERLPGPTFALMSKDLRACQDNILTTQAMAMNGVDTMILQHLDELERKKPR